MPVISVSHAKRGHLAAAPVPPRLNVQVILQLRRHQVLIQILAPRLALGESQEVAVAAAGVVAERNNARLVVNLLLRNEFTEGRQRRLQRIGQGAIVYVRIRDLEHFTNFVKRLQVHGNAQQALGVIEVGKWSATIFHAVRPVRFRMNQPVTPFIVGHHYALCMGVRTRLCLIRGRLIIVQRIRNITRILVQQVHSIHNRPPGRRSNIIARESEG
mmetsp:Transcript_9353/g.16961  ORF Transcript_9353/g.16961 Transcript_9353/m.16961 type:complete len:215 (-) Transcript_9353:346-990(-)